MSNLLDLAIDAHGGWDRWQKLSTATAARAVRTSLIISASLKRRSGTKPSAFALLRMLHRA